MCGIFGIYPHKEAAKITYLGLYALQHRGEESAGIVSCNGKKPHIHKALGLVSDVFDEKIISGLKGDLAVGHVRYSTTGSTTLKNAQPFYVRSKAGHIAIAHNGNLTNAFSLRRILENKGALFQTTMDSEVIAHLIAHSHETDYKQTVIWSLSQLEGAYSLVLMLDKVLIGARDPLGFRPLCLGKLDGAYVLASETCAFDLVGAQYVRDIQPGEIVFICGDKIESVKLSLLKKCACCIFEYIYFSRPDSNIFERSVYQARKRLGENLAGESPVNADLVTPVPDSGTCAALGYAHVLNIPYEMGLIRNHYIGRTFIQPNQVQRDFRVRIKLNPVNSILKDKKVVVIEDSIVRGTTSRARVKAIRQTGAKEVHMRVSCPPLISPCFYGIDFPTKKELIAAKHSIDWIRDFIGVDSLKYLSKEGMLAAMPLPKESFCTACFDGRYPSRLPQKISKRILE
ncbi:MAG: amidophosphoribosyltransferase [Candidatus Omnitrophica bacterium]|nr:amidophosphoribosyltransferase [Candidatus Omnitrophota bacterium]